MSTYRRAFMPTPLEAHVQIPHTAATIPILKKVTSLLRFQITTPLVREKRSPADSCASIKYHPNSSNATLSSLSWALEALALWLKAFAATIDGLLLSSAYSNISCPNKTWSLVLIGTRARLIFLSKPSCSCVWTTLASSSLLIYLKMIASFTLSGGAPFWALGLN